MSTILSVNSPIWEQVSKDVQFYLEEAGIRMVFPEGVDWTLDQDGNRLGFSVQVDEATASRVRDILSKAPIGELHLTVDYRHTDQDE